MINQVETSVVSVNTAREAHERAEGMIQEMRRLEKTIQVSGLSDKWLDQQFVITKGNLRDLSRMFRRMDEVQRNKEK